MELSAIKGIGPTRLESLRAVGVCSLRDLLYFLPQRYEDRTHPIPCADANGGEVLVMGVVQDAPKLSRFNGLTRVTAYLRDDSGKLPLVWYNQPWMMQNLPVGQTVMLFGRMGQSRGKPVLQNAQRVTEPCILPVYRAVKGIPAKSFREMMQQALEQVDDCCPETLPNDLRIRHQLCELNFAIRQAHFPLNVENLRLARRRLAFEQMLMYQAALGLLRGHRADGTALPIPPDAPDEFCYVDPVDKYGEGYAVSLGISSDETSYYFETATRYTLKELKELDDKGSIKWYKYNSESWSLTLIGPSFEDYHGEWYVYAKATNEVGTKYVSSPKLILDCSDPAATVHPSGKELEGKANSSTAAVEGTTYWGNLQFKVHDETPVTVQDGQTVLKPDENGIYTILATPSGARPAWLDKKYPEAMRVGKNGQRNHHGVRHNHCMSSPEYRKKTALMDKLLAEKFGQEVLTMIGFLDGINESLLIEIDLDTVEEDTVVSLAFDKERLYKNMVAAKADWLYELPQWKEIFSEEELKKFYKEQKESTTIRKPKKIGRNDPCPCGSGKKYKKCCGR